MLQGEAFIAHDLERQVRAGTTPAAAAARRILEAFGIGPAGAVP